MSNFLEKPSKFLQLLQDLHTFAPLQSQNFRKKSVWKISNFCEISAKFWQMLQNLQNDAKFQKLQLDNLVDFEKCCKTRIYLQKSVPIQPKTSNILPKFCQKLATTLRFRRARSLAVAQEHCFLRLAAGSVAKKDGSWRYPVPLLGSRPAQAGGSAAEVENWEN